ncbi:RD1 region associated protein [Mycolicibacterium fortuitum]|uniref:RD1 region associated protein n=2 Tax=Mycolicibacterium fortuitum TaxID=1766 RepID=A0A0N9XM94_MYCFO|nr:type VII secretion target [Mycolicibacterium fortuitum]ALI24544.1 RD1 region associated protein [Mycolicibacterium fortuitum]MCA4751291.1 ESX-1 secretion-associated protein [Mycolicibacterium fortuitum]MDG5773118.1 type VII secretion target [Mycolicibacterium fortuitum]MDG5783498.1 type VII secretion target [Mycolicibacterium fortuitum]MDG5785668.1 type VII secretion target [Mycolicibacterium fortuitum]
MSSGELWVTPGHLRELADKHGTAAVQASQATALVDQIAKAVERTHGSACSAAAAAAARVAEARRKACIAIETTSQAYEANLNTAASQYVAVDEHHRDEIIDEIRPRVR